MISILVEIIGKFFVTIIVCSYCPCKGQMFRYPEQKAKKCGADAVCSGTAEGPTGLLVLQKKHMADPSFRVGVMGGTLFTLLTLPWTEIEKAIIMSIVGTATSFFVSEILRKLTRKK